MSLKLTLVCEHLVCVAGPNGTRHLIAFKPTQETVRLVEAWLREGDVRRVVADDCGGSYESQVLARPLKLVYDYGSLVLTLNR